MKRIFDNDRYTVNNVDRFQLARVPFTVDVELNQMRLNETLNGTIVLKLMNRLSFDTMYPYY